MTDPVQTRADTRPSLVICAWSPGETGWDPVEDLSGEPWSPIGARTDPLAADAPEALVEALTARLAEAHCRGLLLVGRTSADDFLVQIRSENRTRDGVRRVDGDTPGIVRATAPAAEMVRALRDAGLPARATSEAEDDVGSYLLYRVLSALPDGADAPAVALLRAPVGASDPAVQRAVKAVAQTIAGFLSPLPRSRAV